MSYIIKIYQASLEAKKISFICLAKNYQQVIGDYFEENYLPDLKRRGIKIREILPDTVENRAAAKCKDLKTNQVRFLKLIEPSESDLLIFNHKVFLISFDPQRPEVLEISDRNMAANLRNQFENLWQSLA